MRRRTLSSSSLATSAVLFLAAASSSSSALLSRNSRPGFLQPHEWNLSAFQKISKRGGNEEEVLKDNVGVQLKKFDDDVRRTLKEFPEISEDNEWRKLMELRRIVGEAAGYTKSRNSKPAASPTAASKASSSSAPYWPRLDALEASLLRVTSELASQHQQQGGGFAWVYKRGRPALSFSRLK